MFSASSEPLILGFLTKAFRCPKKRVSSSLKPSDRSDGAHEGREFFKCITSGFQARLGIHDLCRDLPREFESVRDVFESGL